MSCQESEARSYGGKLGRVVTQPGSDSGSDTNKFHFCLPGAKSVSVFILTISAEGRVVKAADVTLGSENKNTPAPAPRERKSCH